MVNRVVSEDKVEIPFRHIQHTGIQVTDEAAAAVAVAARVSLASIEAKIEAIYHITGSEAIKYKDAPVLECLDRLSICIIVMRNGFMVIGKSAPASPLNYNPELGKRFSYEDAIRQLWPLEGYALRETLYKWEENNQ